MILRGGEDQSAHIQPHGIRLCLVITFNDFNDNILVGDGEPTLRKLQISRLRPSAVGTDVLDSYLNSIIKE